MSLIARSVALQTCRLSPLIILGISVSLVTAAPPVSSSPVRSGQKIFCLLSSAPLSRHSPFPPMCVCARVRTARHDFLPTQRKKTLSQDSFLCKPPALKCVVATKVERVHRQDFLRLKVQVQVKTMNMTSFLNLVSTSSAVPPRVHPILLRWFGNFDQMGPCVHQVCFEV